MEVSIHISPASQELMDNGQLLQESSASIIICIGERRGDREYFKVPNSCYSVRGLERQLVVDAYLQNATGTILHVFVSLGYPGGVRATPTMWTKEAIDAVMS